MDLIPLGSNHSGEGERELSMSQAAMALAEIQTQKVTRAQAFKLINMVGKVAVDTTKINDVVILADGEIRKLYVNYEGIRIKKGEHLAEIYSPKIYAAAQDYLVILNSSELDQDLLASAKTKLILLGAPKSYLNLIEKNKLVPETFILRSPIDGYVENILGFQGMWVKAGQLLCRVIDMSHLWINLDAYETDITWIRYGQKAVIQAEAIPGKEFDGTISFVPPRMNDKTRTTKVRVNIENKNGLLKPDMFVSASVKAEVNEQGQLVLNNLKGKWISPMHPEIIKDQPGVCDVCGMKLVKAEELGYTGNDSQKAPLLIPDTSVLMTGKRAIVYVRKKSDKPLFEGREITLGPKVENSYVVLKGLKEGELVVTKGNFKIDSALQILAKPSMMSIKSTTDEGLESLKVIDNDDLNSSLEDFLDYYLNIQKELTQDRFEKVLSLSKSMKSEVQYFDYSTLSKEENKIWVKLNESLLSAMEHLEHNQDIKSYRKSFKQVSVAVINLLDVLQYHKDNLNVMFCSMAGSSWLQEGKEIKNPYYGKSMLNCGVLKKSMQASKVSP